jgi:hypothetical protein
LVNNNNNPNHSKQVLEVHPALADNNNNSQHKDSSAAGRWVNSNFQSTNTISKFKA